MNVYCIESVSSGQESVFFFASFSASDLVYNSEVDTIMAGTTRYPRITFTYSGEFGRTADWVRHGSLVKDAQTPPVR
jgi:hypothetical protein